MNQPRVYIASFGASVVLLSVVVLGLWAGVVAAGIPMWDALDAAVSNSAFFVFFFGLPLCFALSSVLGWILVGLEHRQSGPLSWTWKYGVPSALAAMSFPTVWWWFWGRPFAPMMWAVAGAIAGFVAAVVFWKLVQSRENGIGLTSGI